MAFITEHGSLWGMVPETTGRVFWVAPSDGYTIEGRAYRSSDEHDGRSPERALRTVAKAWTLVSATCGDIIVLLPGAHTVATTVSMNVAGVTMTGLPRYSSGSALRPITTITVTASADILSVAAANVEVAWLHFIPLTTMDSIAVAVTVSTGTHIHHCSFDMETAAASTSTKGINSAMTGQAAMYFHDLVFFCDGAQGAAIDFGLSAGSGGNLVERCTFLQSTGTWAHAIRTIYSADGNRGNLIRECDFIIATDATLTIGIAGSAGTTEESTHVHRCYFSDSVSVAVDTFGARGAELAENYQAGVGATDGGVLITAIT